MKYELSKVLGQKKLCLLLALVVVLNAILFYGHCTDNSKGYALGDLREAYSRADTLEQEQAELEEKMVEHILSNSEDHAAYEAISDRMHINRDVLERLRQVWGYAEYRESLVAEAQIKQMLGLFQEGFPTNSLMKGAAVYEALAHVQPQGVFLGSAEALLGWKLTDMLMLVFVLAAGLILFTYEKRLGLTRLTRPAYHGMGRLYLRKVLAAITVTAVGFVLLYGGNLAVAGGVLGFDNLGVPAQSLYGYAACPYDISVGGLLAQTLLWKFAWALVCLLVVVCVCVSTPEPVLAGAVLAVLGGAAAWMNGTTSLWLRNLSLWHLSGMEKLYQGAVYLNLFTYPLDRLLAAGVFFLVAGVGAYFLGLAFHCRLLAVGARELRLPGLPRLGGHTRLFSHEVSKALGMQKGAWILLALLALQLSTYSNVSTFYSQDEVYYRSYSRQLMGLPTPEKAAFLEQEAKRLDDLAAQLMEMEETGGEEIHFSQAYQTIRDQLDAQLPFRDAQDQYNSLRPGQSYLYQTPYTRLYGPEAPRENLLNLGKLLFAMALAAAGVFAVERETGVGILQKTAGKTKRIALFKGIWLAIWSALAVLAVQLPRYWGVFRAFGGLDLSAWANSAQWLSQVPDGITVLGWMILTYLGWTALTWAAVALVCWISKKSTNTVFAVLISLAVLLLPVGVALLLVI